MPESVKKILEEKRRAPRKQLVEFNRRRTQSIQIENKKVLKDAASEIKNISRYELLLIGAALYWAEGYNKQEGRVHSPYLSFGNSNPGMVNLFIHFLKEAMQTPMEKMRPFVQIHNNIDAESAITFWAKICNIPKERFRVTHQISRASKGRRPHNSLPYGTFKLDVSGRQNFFKVKGWIDGIIKNSTAE
ncbi:MAG: hypothetical protein PHF44_01600 [Candidatus Pacebacteria bacterium]|nr:hypothetical protein [Candidatus Paceibacterota bacterium]